MASILSFDCKLKQKQERERSQQAEEYFVNDILPYLTCDDKVRLQEVQYDVKRFNFVLSRILRKIN